jgi:hypothetical protein
MASIARAPSPTAAALIVSPGSINRPLIVQGTWMTNDIKEFLSLWPPARAPAAETTGARDQATILVKNAPSDAATWWQS